MISRLSVATVLSVAATIMFLTTASAAPPMASSPSVPPRTVSVDDPAPVQYTANSIVPVVFTVTLNGPALLAGERVTVHFATADYCGTGTATRWAHRDRGTQHTR
jgi:hypothetical protein